MKKLALIAALAGLSVTSAFAAGTLTATPSTNQISATSGTFNVTVSLSSAATNISAFDLFLQSNSAGANAFTITNTVPVLDAAEPPTRATTPQFPDTFTTTGSTQSGFFQNTHDQGFAYGTDQTLSGSTTLETLTISYNFASAPAPGTSFTFGTTASGANSPNTKGTYFYSDNFATYNQITTPGSFTVSVVPEPATCSLLGLGATGTFLLQLLRKRRAS
jgi:hypothetical protein